MIQKLRGVSMRLLLPQAGADEKQGIYFAWPYRADFSTLKMQGTQRSVT